MPRVILIRHGETDWSRDGRWQGWSDVPLNDKGMRQARELVEPLARQHPTHLVCSDLIRTQQTLQPLADALGIAPVVDPDVKEIDVGSWAGLSHGEAEARYPDGVARHDAGGTGWEDGETYADIAVRGERALLRHTDGLPESALLVVCSHGGLIGATVGRLLGLSADEQRQRLGRPSHGHATYLKRKDGDGDTAWRLLAYNTPLWADAGPPFELTIL
ncbi:MAG: histidine phosphatase family protein [Gaiellales bacterium]